MKTEGKEHFDLESIGLSQDESNIYSLLLKRGGMFASSIARISGVSRVMVYRTLDQLISKKLVSKTEKKGEIARFFPEHPFGLGKLVDEEKRAIERKEKALEGIIGSLSADFVRLTGEPGVRVLVGVSGYKESLQDIEKTEGEICLIRTARDQDSPEILASIHEHIVRRVKKGIHTRIIAPFLDSYTKEVIVRDNERLVERRFIPKDQLQTTAQLTIYDDKVATVSYQAENPIITIIQDKDISRTFLSMFNYMWQQADEYTREAMQVLLEREET